MKQTKIITIGREFGARGKSIGKKIADELGIAFYDKELIAEAAKFLLRLLLGTEYSMWLKETESAKKKQRLKFPDWIKREHLFTMVFPIRSGGQLAITIFALIVEL